MIKITQTIFLFLIYSVIPLSAAQFESKIGEDWHAPSIIETQNNTLLCSWYSTLKTKSGYASAIYLTSGTFLETSITPLRPIWSVPIKILESDKTRYWNPVFALTSDGTVILFYKEGISPRSLKGYYISSANHGQTWTLPTALPESYLGPTKNKPLLLQDGSLVCGSSREFGEPNEQNASTCCFVEIASAGLKTWKKYGPLKVPHQPFGCIEPTIFYSNSKTLTMFCRNRAAKHNFLGFTWFSESHDNGKSWSQFTETILPNPDTPCEFITLKDQKGCLGVMNPIHDGRSELALFLYRPPNIEQIARLEKGAGEYSFPSLVQTYNSGFIHIVYSHREDKISPRTIMYRCQELIEQFDYLSTNSQAV